MDKKESRREKLAKIRFDAIQPRQGRGERFADRAFDLWQRFTAFSGLEKAFFISGCALALALAIGALIALSQNAGGGDDQAAVVNLPTRPPAATPAPVTPTSTVALLVFERPTAEPSANREDCDAISGTEYQSDEERDWFLENCQDTGPANVSGPPQSRPSPSGPSLPPPTATPPPAPAGFTSAQAVSLAVSWMASGGSESYTVDAGSCTSVDIGDHWVVTCPATLAGCQGPDCETTLSVCVFESNGRVVPAERC